MFTYVETHEKTPLEIYFMYLENYEIYGILKTYCIISVFVFEKMSFTS